MWGIPERIAQKKSELFIFIVFLNSLGQEDCIAQKKKKVCSEVSFFALKISTQHLSQFFQNGDKMLFFL